MNRKSSGIITDNIVPLTPKMTSTINTNNNNVVAEASSSSSSLSKSIRKSVTHSMFDQSHNKNYRYHQLKSEVKKRIHMLKPLINSGAITSSGVLQVFEQLVADEDDVDASLNEFEENAEEEEDEQEENGTNNNNTFNYNDTTTTTTTRNPSPPRSSNTELESQNVKYENIDDTDMFENMEQDPLEFAQANMKIISTQSIQPKSASPPTNTNTNISHFNISLNPFSHHSYMEQEYEEEEQQEQDEEEEEYQSTSKRRKTVKPSQQASSSTVLTRKKRPPMRKRKATSLALVKKKQNNKVPRDKYFCPQAEMTGCENRFPDRVTARRCGLKHGPKGWPYVCRLCKHWWVGRVCSNYYRDLKNFSLHLQHDHKGKTVEEYQELFPHQQFLVDEDWPIEDENVWMLEANL